MQGCEPMQFSVFLSQHEFGRENVMRFHYGIGIVTETMMFNRRDKVTEQEKLSKLELRQ